MSAAPSDPPYRDPSLPIEARLDDLLARMTPEEKRAQIGGAWSSALLEDGRLSETKAAALLAHGIGHVTRIGGATVLTPAESARAANAIQRFLLERTRLGIPAVIHEESCAGYCARGATCFPQALGLAATFEPSLAEAMSDVIRRQMLAVGARHALAPVLDVARDPRWGRTEETFGEDPFLAAQMGVAYVRGLQGPSLREGVAATAKHFIGYGASEGGMNWAPAHLGPRELRDVYAFPFEAAIRDARIASVMNAYNEIDGEPAGASRAILTDLLRGELGFDGPVVSDYFTVSTLAGYHRVARDKGEAARLALEAGLDLELPATDCFGEPLRTALAAGAVDHALVDTAARRVLRSKLELGLFERPFVDADAAPALFDTPPQRALARRIARKSIVLLRNEGGVLPLRRDLRRLAVIGPAADSIRLLQGDYHYPSHLEITFGAADEHDVAPRPAGAKPNLGLHFPRTTSVLAGLRARAGADARILHARGCDVLDPSTGGFAEAIAAARAAEVAVLVVGGRSGLVDGCTSGESIDRATLGLPGVQQALVEAVVAAGTPTVLVLIDGRPLALPWIAAHVPAVVAAWLPGEEGGAAVADVLFGDENPAGRLPVSFPASEGQLPVYYAHKPSGGRSHWKGSYVDGSTKPLFAFGHGLSYTRFAYDELEIAPARIAPDGEVRIAATIANVGERAGEEVVQLYVRDAVASVTRPVQELRGFVRLALAPGERRRVTFTLAAAQLGFHDRALRYVVEPGTIEVKLGASSEDLRLEGAFEIVGETSDVRALRRFATPVTVA